MRTALRSTWALLLGMGLLMLGNGLQGSLLGLRASIEGFATTVTGLLMSGYFIGFLLGSQIAARLVAQVGHTRVFAALASLGSTAVLIHAVFIDPKVWFLLRVLTGFCYAGLYVVAESWLNDRATNATRGKLLSVYMVVLIGGLALGQLLLNLADPAGYDLFVLASVLISLALLPLLLSAGPTPAFAATEPMGLKRVYRRSPLGLLGTVGTGMSHGAILGMGVIYAEKVGLSVAQISLFMGLILLGSVVLQWPLGLLSDRYDRRLVITAVTTMAAVFALAAIPVGGNSVIGLMALAFLIGGLAFPLYSLCVAHTNDALQPEQMVAASSTLVLASGAGAVFGPMLAAGAMDTLGPHGYFVAIAAVHGVVALFALYRMTRREARPLDEQGGWVPVPRASQVGVAMAQAEAGERAVSDP